MQEEPSTRTTQNQCCVSQASVCLVNLSPAFLNCRKYFHLLPTLLSNTLWRPTISVGFTWLTFSRYTGAIACPLLDTLCSLVCCWAPDNGCGAHSVSPHWKSYPNTANASQHILPKPAGHIQSPIWSSKASWNERQLHKFCVNVCIICERPFISPPTYIM